MSSRREYEGFVIEETHFDRFCKNWTGISLGYNPELKMWAVWRVDVDRGEWSFHNGSFTEDHREALRNYHAAITAMYAGPFEIDGIPL